MLGASPKRKSVTSGTQKKRYVDAVAKAYDLEYLHHDC
jgi:hypothetical protein